MPLSFRGLIDFLHNRRESGAKTAPNAVWGRLSLLNSLVVRRFAPSKRRMKFAAIVAEREAFGNNGRLRRALQCVSLQPLVSHL
jgi:hypothetical protein